jgi:Tfp pilus assembly protein PilV
MFQDSLNKKGKIASKDGISLTELIISVVFFGIIATSLSVPISNSLYLNTTNSDVNAANSLARSYLEDLKDSWKTRNDFENGNLVAVGNNYTANGKYTVEVTPQTLLTDTAGNAVIRRVNVIYKDSNNNVLCDITLDFNRPGNIQTGM